MSCSIPQVYIFYGVCFTMLYRTTSCHTSLVSTCSMFLMPRYIIVYYVSHHDIPYFVWFSTWYFSYLVSLHCLVFCFHISTHTTSCCIVSYFALILSPCWIQDVRYSTLDYFTLHDIYLHYVALYCGRTKVWPTPSFVEDRLPLPHSFKTAYKILRRPGRVNRTFPYPATPQDMWRHERPSRSKLLASRCSVSSFATS